MLREIVESLKKSESMSETDRLLMNVENEETIYHLLRKAKNTKQFKKIVLNNEHLLFDDIEYDAVDWEEAFKQFNEE